MSVSPPPSQDPTTSHDRHHQTFRTLARELGDGVFTCSRFRDNLRLHVHPARLFDLLTVLKQACGFEMLAELNGIDYLGYPGRTRPRFEVTYGLLNLDSSERVWVKVALDDPNPTLPSVVSLWLAADWMEREVFDLYGIRFTGHPDLRRILLPDEFLAHPMRKDYPLRGRGERHNFPRIPRADS